VSPSAATDAATPLEDLDTRRLVVPRGPFCDRIDPEAVTLALGEEPAHVSAYRSGQRISISDDVTDVVHEFGCRWTVDGSTAEAWVYAPPVAKRRATALARDVTDGSKCLRATTPHFGRPSASCASRHAEGVTMRYQGLFGDAWLTCSLTLGEGDREMVADRASRWCAAVATGASTAG
jgi:hypothetical protein